MWGCLPWNVYHFKGAEIALGNADLKAELLKELPKEIKEMQDAAAKEGKGGKDGASDAIKELQEQNKTIQAQNQEMQKQMTAMTAMMTAMAASMKGAPAAPTPDGKLCTQICIAWAVAAAATTPPPPRTACTCWAQIGWL